MELIHIFNLVVTYFYTQNLSLITSRDGFPVSVISAVKSNLTASNKRNFTVL